MSDAVILIVDDEPSILKSLKRTFFEYPYKIVIAASPGMAKEYLAVNTVDIILSDYKMPNESGLDLLSFIRDNYPGIIRIMLSGYVEKEAILESLFSCAALSFFPKPWDDNKLIRRISELLEIKKDIKDPFIWEIVNSGQLFGISNNEISKLSLDKNNVKLPDKRLKFVSDNMLLFFNVVRIVHSDYFKRDSNFELAETIKIIGWNNLQILCKNIMKPNLSKPNVYSIMPEIFDIYYDSIYKLISGSDTSRSLSTNLPFIFIYNYLLYQTNRTEYLRRIESFINNGSTINSRILVNNLFKKVLRLYKLPNIFYEKCEDVELNKTYPFLAAKKLRDLVELFWWSDQMPKGHPLFRLYWEPCGNKI